MCEQQIVSQFLHREDRFDEGGDEKHRFDSIDEGFLLELRCSICLKQKEDSGTAAVQARSIMCSLVGAASNSNQAKCPTCRNIIEDKLEVSIDMIVLIMK